MKADYMVALKVCSKGYPKVDSKGSWRVVSLAYLKACKLVLGMEYDQAVKSESKLAVNVAGLKDAILGNRSAV